jgi:hypothetical protein
VIKNVRDTMMPMLSSLLRDSFAFKLRSLSLSPRTCDLITDCDLLPSNQRGDLWLPSFASDSSDVLPTSTSDSVKFSRSFLLSLRRLFNPALGVGVARP